MNKQKRMIYIYEENVEFYDNLENKSEFINRALSERKNQGEGTKVHDNLQFVKDKIKALDAQGK